MLEKKLVTIIKILVYLAFVMPLIVMGTTFIFPFVFPKAIYFRILVEIMLGLYVVLCSINKSYRPKKTPLFWSVTILFLILLASSLFGVDFSRSLWGNHERMSGWFTLIHFGIYFVIVSGIFKSFNEWRWLLRASLIVSIIVGFTGLNFLLPADSIMKIGGGGTLGNFIYVANFLLFHVFIAWFLFRREENKFWKYLAMGAGIMEIMIMVYNGKRGPFLGLLAGLFVGVLLYSAFTKIKKWRILGLGLIGFSIILSLVVFLNRQTTFIQRIPMVGALANISFQSGTGETRAIAWEIAYKAWKERPIFGWGVENFYYAFNKYYNPKSLEHGYYETWFDRSHNIFLDYLSTSGILGFLAYLGIFGTVAYVLWRGFKMQRLDLDLLVLFSIFFTGYALQNLFVFDHLSSYLVFFLMLAFLNQTYQMGNGPANSKPIKKNLASPSSGPVILMVIIISFLIYKTNVLPALANNRSLRAQMALGSSFVNGVEIFKQSLNTYTPHLLDIRSDFARTILSFADNSEALKSDVYKQAISLMILELNKTVTDHPLELNAYLLLGQLYGVQGDVVKSEEAFLKGQELSPKRQQVAYMITRLRYNRRDFQGAINELEKALYNDPRVADSYWYLSLVYNDLGDYQKSYDYLKQALEKGKNPTQPAEIVFIAELFKKFGDYIKSAEYFEMAIQAVPSDPKLLLSASEVYSLSGNKEKAREMADRASVYDPTALEKAKAWLK